MPNFPEQEVLRVWLSLVYNREDDTIHCFFSLLVYAECMSKNKVGKTSGGEWLFLSMAAFNGSGYADKTTPEQYIASYKAYKTWRKDNRALECLQDYPDVAYPCAENMCARPVVDHVPSDKNIKKFMQYYDPDNVQWDVAPQQFALF